MRIPRLPARPWVAAATVVAAVAILLTVLHQGDANANTGPPDTPGNPLAHLIVPSNETPASGVSWDAPDTPVSGYTHHQNRRPGVPSRRRGHHFQTTRCSQEPRTPTPSPPTAPMAPAHPLNQRPQDVPDAPSAPGNLTGAVAEPEATDETATINLTWLASTVPAPDQCDTAYPLTGYTIVRSDGDQETDLGTAEAGATSFNDSTAAFSTNYTYRVAARSAIGASTASETSVSVFSRPVLPPTGLTASMADPFDGNVSLSWNAPTEGATIIDYLVLRYLGADPYEGTDEPTTIDGLGTQTSLVDATASAGVTYSYIVIARSDANVSPPSDSVVIEAPAPASGLTATAGDGAIDLSWSAPAAGTVATYRVASAAAGRRLGDPRRHGRFQPLRRNCAGQRHVPLPRAAPQPARRLRMGGIGRSDLGGRPRPAHPPHRNGERQRQRTRLDGARQPIHRRLPRPTPRRRRRLEHSGQQPGSRQAHLHPPRHRLRRDAPLRRAGPQLCWRRPMVRHRVHRPHHATLGALGRKRSP